MSAGRQPHTPGAHFALLVVAVACMVLIGALTHPLVGLALWVMECALEEGRRGR